MLRFTLGILLLIIIEHAAFGQFSSLQLDSIAKNTYGKRERVDILEIPGKARIQMETVLLDSINKLEYYRANNLFNKTLQSCNALLASKNRKERFALTQVRGNYWIRVYANRAWAKEKITDFTGAVKDLDSCIYLRGFPDKSYEYLYCDRGRLRLNKLNDANGCEDLNKCRELENSRKDRYAQEQQELQVKKPKAANFVRLPNSYFNGCKIYSRSVPGRFSKLTEPLWMLDRTSLKAGYLYQEKSAIELGLLLSEEKPYEVNWGPSVGIEIYPKPFLVAPKLSIEAELAFIGGRIDVGYYRYHGIQDVRITPQLGLSLLGYLNLFYGYSIPVANENLAFIGRNRISLFFNFLRFDKPWG